MQSWRKMRRSIFVPLFCEQYEAEVDDGGPESVLRLGGDSIIRQERQRLFHIDAGLNRNPTLEY